MEERRRSWLPSEALVELEGRGGLEQRIGGGVVLGTGGLPKLRTAGGCHPLRSLIRIQSEKDMAPHFHNLNGGFDRFLRLLRGTMADTLGSGVRGRETEKLTFSTILC